jgi:hypothetical protein
MNDGLLRFMRAHGQKPAPGQRPRAAGALAGMWSGVAALPLLMGTGALASIAHTLGVSDPMVAVMYLGVATIGGAVYGGVFRRAASDRRGGWLFGISYGFLLWMLGPVTLLQVVLGRPLAIGVAAMGLLGAHLLTGLILGVLFRPMHRVVQATGKRITQSQTAHPTRTRPVGFPHAKRIPHE